MSHIERIPVPSPRAPQIRQKKPASFERPRIDLDGGRVKRDWKRILACDIQTGDTVPGVGLIVDVNHFFSADADSPFTVHLQGAGSVMKALPGNHEVLVFAPVEESL